MSVSVQFKPLVLSSRFAARNDTKPKTLRLSQIVSLRELLLTGQVPVVRKGTLQAVDFKTLNGDFQLAAAVLLLRNIHPRRTEHRHTLETDQHPLIETAFDREREIPVHPNDRQKQIDTAIRKKVAQLTEERRSSSKKKTILNPADLVELKRQAEAEVSRMEKLDMFTVFQRYQQGDAPARRYINDCVTHFQEKFELRVPPVKA